ncbi:protein RER1A [Neltuma alba]|uniref:protein RER1A n=1 Tax=Neltuma alba TaxID=207710 RepID=UPI0010A4AAA0|nr:protein RER1A-like [Prosopis alba]XP_028765766.1 protein RER1A-like [Prosopis alba]XP_028765767.1 protein RER1A-like [Prosopis alba]
MEGTGGGSAAAAAPVNQWWQDLSRIFQHYLDISTPHTTYRWIGTLVLASIYALRVFYVQGFYIVSYGLGIYLLNLLIGFLSPLVDPELETSDGPMLPTKGSDEFKPFIRRLPEFKFWYSITKAFCTAFVMTFFSIFDVPVFWPILLFYWIVLFALTMRRQIAHMIKYKYIPFNFGKQKYGGKKSSASSSGARPE